MNTTGKHKPAVSGEINNSWRFAILLAVILAGGLLVNGWAYIGEARIERRELKGFPERVGSWQRFGGDERFDASTEEVLRADDYLSRNYRMPNGRTASLYVGYYATQSNGASYHSPLNCLPGSGWTMSDQARIVITPKDGRPVFEANRYVIQNGNDKELLVYWYQGRGRAVASEYWGKIYTVLDSVRRRRSDGAMVRVMVPLRSAEPEALAAAQDFAGSVAPVLPAFVPD